MLVVFIWVKPIYAGGNASYTHGLAWKTLKDLLEDRGVQNLYGSREATRQAFALGLLQDGEI